MSVENLERSMSADELDEWMQFAAIEPFGNEERMFDQRNSLLCAVIKNSSQRGGDATLDSFLMYSNPTEDEEDQDHEDWGTKLLYAITKT